ncbi:atp-binding cassette transporter [Moniliophthora roreri MCA 2997]|uniref:Atp-binding cassette transporter n=2 Tax=Moniliophthora roreri TaxID=221103 RepID=V2Y0G8_MONRO|nr:atp-binding cassette transporter [Moniliophthora roreri MCA 2997]
MFEAGDQAEVGERGLTLSGRQKARVALAHAVYSRASIILLDDILAALDVHTSNWVVQKCLGGDLVKGRTVVLVTHSVALLQPIAAFVVAVKNDNVIGSSDVNDALSTTDIEAAVTGEMGSTESSEELVEPEVVSAPSMPPGGNSYQKRSQRRAC